MSFQGRIEDVSVADVIQLIRLGGHSGTLTMRHGEDEALIGFERGRLVSAWSARSLRLGEMLMRAGFLQETTLEKALQMQESERPHRPLGQILVRMGAVTSENIRQVIASEIERVLQEVLAWPGGDFDFAVDDLTPVVEVSRLAGTPKVDLDTQQVLLQVLQTMEEEAAHNNMQPPTPSEVRPEDSEAIEEFVDVLSTGGRRKTENDLPAVSEAVPNEATITAENQAVVRPRFQLVSPDTELLNRINLLLEMDGDHMSAVAYSDAGVSLLGEPPPIVVVDLRYQPQGIAALSALCRTRPRASVIALFEGRAPLREIYQAGAVAISSVAPDTIAACLRSLARQRRYLSNENAIAEGVRANLARLRRIITDLRSGLLATSVSLNLLNVIAESIDRGILFVPDSQRLVAIGAFGQTAHGDNLAVTTQNLVLPVGNEGVFFECLKDSQARTLNFDAAGLPQAFLETVDRPATGEIAVLPVPGSQRVIAVLYLDNGSRDRPLGDTDLFELAAFQLGLALENEFLRRDSALAQNRQLG